MSETYAELVHVGGGAAGLSSRAGVHSYILDTLLNVRQNRCCYTSLAGWPPRYGSGVSDLERNLGGNSLLQYIDHVEQKQKCLQLW